MAENVQIPTQKPFQIPVVHNVFEAMHNPKGRA